MRDGRGGWRTLTYAQALDGAMRIGSWLLAHGASAERPLLILSGNTIEHGLLSLAGMAVNATIFHGPRIRHISEIRSTASPCARAWRTFTRCARLASSTVRRQRCAKSWKR